MDEFRLIRDIFAPLAQDFAPSLGLLDDAAVLPVPAGYELVITKDALSQGVHFIGNEDPALIAKKALRTNLSDLAAMGATPYCYFLAVMLPKHPPPHLSPLAGGGRWGEWLQRFAQGLVEDQAQYGLHLAGGDTIATRGDLSISITALGLVRQGVALKRSSAQVGDLIYVSGTLGDSALGLDCLQGRLPRNDFLQQRYLLPEPRVALGQKLVGIATACMDISDGLLQDLGHLCTASGVGARVQCEALPLSPAASARVAKDNTLWKRIVSGGDDYELLFTIPHEKQALLTSIARKLDVMITPIGMILAGQAVSLLNEQGKPIIIGELGFQHFS